MSSYYWSVIIKNTFRINYSCLCQEPAQCFLLLLVPGSAWSRVPLMVTISYYHGHTCECRHAAHSGGGGGPGAPRQEQEAPGQGSGQSLSSAPCC